MLKEIGRQLDSDIYPIVKNGGILTPSRPAKSQLFLGEKVEEKNEKSRQGRGRPKEEGHQIPPHRSSAQIFR